MDRSKLPNNQKDSYKPTIVQEEKKSSTVNIPAPGSTGIPQIDQISASKTRQFPNPSEFNFQHTYSPVSQSNNEISVPSQNEFLNILPQSANNLNLTSSQNDFSNISPQSATPISVSSQNVFSNMLPQSVNGMQNVFSNLPPPPHYSLAKENSEQQCYNKGAQHAHQQAVGFY